MGVPGFVAWLYHNHKKTNFIFKHLFKSTAIQEITDLEQLELDNYRVESVQHLLIDANCLIHPQAHKICVENPNLVESNLELLERKIIKQVIEYIQTLIDQTKPTKSIYISVDGVAPMAKIKQQRLRRFKTAYDRKMMENLAKRYNKPVQKEWNNSAITPGTIFMDKLMKAILIWVKSTTFNCKVIFSSSYTPGEGEHKLLQYLKNSEVNDDVNVIYGLDADLLFLSLASERNKLYLMRETSQMEIDGSHVEGGFSYLSIEMLKKIIIEEMNQRLTSDRMWDNKCLVNDFIFLCYFCGNDFIPHIPSLSIKPHSKYIPNGIDTVINSYTDAMKIVNISTENTKYLIEIFLDEHQEKHIHINLELFIKILETISNQEKAYYEDFNKYKRFFKNLDSKDPYELEKFNYDQNVIERYYDPIHLGDPRSTLIDWKKKYYKHYYGKDTDPANLGDNTLNVILDEYIKGLVWTMYYYYDKCKDYEWCFMHHHGPFISDLMNYIKRFPDRVKKYEDLYSISGVWFYNQIKPLQQLMLVLPHESSYLVPSSYRTLMFGVKLKDYFPNNITEIPIDYLYKNMAWLNVPMIPIIPARTILALTQNVILKDEADRNKTYPDYVKEI